IKPPVKTHEFPDGAPVQLGAVSESTAHDSGPVKALIILTVSSMINAPRLLVMSATPFPFPSRGRKQLPISEGKQSLWLGKIVLPVGPNKICGSVLSALAAVPVLRRNRAMERKLKSWLT